jgi:NET1-associated nuclear protein 1 (U3 small nucleolar RNA-associated protein 17)
VDCSWAYPSSISWVRRSMYFSQRSPTTCIIVSMRRAWSWMVELYLAAGEATDRDNHSECACESEICTKFMRPAVCRRGATKGGRQVVSPVPCNVKESCPRALTTSVPRAVKSFRNYFDWTRALRIARNHQTRHSFSRFVAHTPSMAETTAQLKRKRESAIGLQKKAKKPRKNDAPAGQDAAPVAEPTPEPQAQDKSKATPRKVANSVRDQDEGKVEESKAQTTSHRSVSQDTETSTKKSFKEKVLESKEAAKAEVGDSQKPQAPVVAKAKKQKHKWALSPAQGGWFLPTDPVFSLDETYLILANPKALQIYFTETSLLANVLPVGPTGFVTAYALSSTKPTQVYVADSTGLITLWDWVDGTKIGRWDIGAVVRNMAVVTQPGSDEDLVYCHETGDKHIVNVHALRTKSQATKTELKRVLKMASSITSLQVLLQGKYVVVATADTITVGKRVKVSRTAVQEFEYVWRELKFSKRVTTCNMYFRKPESSDKGKKTAQDQRDILELAVGDEEGAILLFEDILASFAAIESFQKGSKNRSDSADSLRPKRLHWHREAVGSVKWSLDGKQQICELDDSMLTMCRQLPHLWW